MLRKQFLKEHRSAKYQYLLLTGKLTKHLNQIDQEARKQVEILMEQMVKKQGATEELKAQDQMKWVRLMINIKIQCRRNCSEKYDIYVGGNRRYGKGSSFFLFLCVLE